MPVSHLSSSVLQETYPPVGSNRATFLMTSHGPYLVFVLLLLDRMLFELSSWETN